MNRRAFILGAVAAPALAPAITQAVKPTVVGMDLAASGTVSKNVVFLVGEAGRETVLPSVHPIVTQAADLPERFLRGLKDAGEFEVKAS